MAFGVGDVLRYVALRVDDCSYAAALIGDQIRRVRETAQVVLLEQHAQTPPARSRGCPQAGTRRSS